MAENNSAAIFYADEWLNQEENTVRLLDPKNNDQVVVTGFILTDSFDIEITHNFENMGGLNGVPVIGTAIGAAKNFLKTAQSSSILIGQAGRAMIGGTRQIFNESGLAGLSDKLIGSGTSTAITEGLNTADSFINDIDSYLQNNWSQKHMDFADDYLFQFKGTSITFPTRFSKILLTDRYDLSDGGDIEEDVWKILDRLVGDYEEPEEGGFVGWTAPPNGYKASLQGLKNTNPEGTFSMLIGTKFRCPGVVVNGISISASRVKVQTSKGLKPLFIEIDFSVQPMVKYTKKMLQGWLSKTENK